MKNKDGKKVKLDLKINIDLRVRMDSTVFLFLTFVINYTAF